jgi:hypothetical protein
MTRSFLTHFIEIALKLETRVDMSGKPCHRPVFLINTAAKLEK